MPTNRATEASPLRSGEALLRHRQFLHLQRRDRVRAVVRGVVAARAVVAAQADAAEGELAAGAGGGAVPVHDAGTDLPEELLVQLPPVAQKRGGQSELRVVRLANRGVEVGDADHLEERPEPLNVLA